MFAQVEAIQSGARLLRKQIVGQIYILTTVRLDFAHPQPHRYAIGNGEEEALLPHAIGSASLSCVDLCVGS